MTDRENQCDGCKLKLPIENGIHIHPDKEGWERAHMICTKFKYEQARMLEKGETKG